MVLLFKIGLDNKVRGTVASFLTTLRGLFSISATEKNNKTYFYTVTIPPQDNGKIASRISA